MKFAVYMTAGKEDYRRWAGYFAHSLRTLGGYLGDIVVFADGPVDGPDVIVRPLEPVMENHWPDLPYMNYCFSRVLAGQILLDEGYEGLFYSDVDCLAISAVGPIIEPVTQLRSDKLWVFLDKMLRPAGQSKYHNGYLTLEEKKDQYPSLCAGTLLGSAAVLEDLFPEWRRICIEDNYGILAGPANHDQAALNAWCLRNPARCEIATREEIWAGGWMPHDDRTRILHFCVQDKSAAIEKAYKEICNYVQAQE